MRKIRNRRQALALGYWAEFLARWYLRFKGYSVLASDYRTPVGEIDVIARRGRILAFVEVKRRATRSAALDAVTRRQQNRIARAADAFLARRPDLAALDRRFDVIVFAGLSRPLHIKSAWHMD